MKSWDAKEYDDSYRYVSTAAADLLEMLAPKPGERIVDLGCGAGSFTAKIAERGAEVLGLDSSAAMVAQAQARFPSLRFETADACRWRTDKKFDAVFSNAVLHWILDAEGAAETIAQALKPGGRLVAELGGHGNVHQIHEAIRDAYTAVVGEPAPEIWYFPTVGEYAVVLEHHGLEPVSMALFDRPTPLAKGVREWVEMFGSPFVERIDPSKRPEFLKRVEELSRDALFHGGHWTADYRRLRVVARRLP